MWRYYTYLNDVGHPGVAGALLVLVAVLNAARNSLSFFLLLITAMGYGIVRPSLGSVMLRVRLLAMVHFVFGVLSVRQTWAAVRLRIVADAASHADTRLARSSFLLKLLASLFSSSSSRYHSL